MIEIRLVPEDYQLAELVSSLEAVSSKAMPSTYRAFKMATALVQYTWKSYAMGAPIPGGGPRLKNPSGGYAKSIKIRTLTPLAKEIYSDSPIAHYLEEGTKQYDMKETHPFGKRSRVVKKDRYKNGKLVASKGDAYLVIPFRHGVPGTASYGGMLPSELYKIIRNGIKEETIILSSLQKGRKVEPNYKGELIPRKKYNWGTRLTGIGVRDLEGMVVMDVSTKKSVRSGYMTFRVISVNSPANKWIQKARAGKHITQFVVKNTSAAVNDIIISALKKDMGVFE